MPEFVLLQELQDMLWSFRVVVHINRDCVTNHASMRVCIETPKKDMVYQEENTRNLKPREACLESPLPSSLLRTASECSQERKWVDA